MILSWHQVDKCIPSKSAGSPLPRTFQFGIQDAPPTPRRGWWGPSLSQQSNGQLSFQKIALLWSLSEESSRTEMHGLLVWLKMDSTLKTTNVIPKQATRSFCVLNPVKPATFLFFSSFGHIWQKKPDIDRSEWANGNRIMLSEVTQTGQRFQRFGKYLGSPMVENCSENTVARKMQTNIDLCKRNIYRRRFGRTLLRILTQLSQSTLHPRKKERKKEVKTSRALKETDTFLLGSVSLNLFECVSLLQRKKQLSKLSAGVNWERCAWKMMIFTWKGRK